jgi:hypothetical protein
MNESARLELAIGNIDMSSEQITVVDGYFGTVLFTEAVGITPHHAELGITVDASSIVRATVQIDATPMSTSMLQLHPGIDPTRANLTVVDSGQLGGVVVTICP